MRPASFLLKNHLLLGHFPLSFPPKTRSKKKNKPPTFLLQPLLSPPFLIDIPPPQTSSLANQFSTLPMEKIPTWVISISFPLLLLLTYSANAEKDDVKLSLISFLRKLSSNNSRTDLELGWNASLDPCLNGWAGVDCKDTNTVRKIVLEGLGLDGSIDAGLLCKAESLTVVSLRDNELHGQLPPEISNCTELTGLYLGGNRLSGSLPTSLSLLSNLKRLNISFNNFSGELPPDLPRISGLKTFLARNNSLDGTIPQLDFSNLKEFDVAYNRFSGPVPEGAGLESLVGNAGLCGEPLPAACPPAPSPSPGEKKKSKNLSADKAIMFSGYIALGLVVLLFFTYKLVYRRKADAKKDGSEKKAADSSTKSSSGSKTAASRSEYSLPASNESPAAVSSSLVVLVNPTTKELKFEDLLKAPAELLGRGRFGSLYKVMIDDTTALAVKRIKDWAISAEDFRKRMERIDRVKHPNVLSAVAFYCSTQEKLLVYEYQKNGSLFKLLRGSQNGQAFDWGSRLSAAGGIADGLAFMHQELHDYGIGHGNLKSSNILIKTNMDPCISEYGLMTKNNHQSPPAPSDNIQGSILKADIYNFGIILLEMLTGKVTQNNGSELARWVNSVVREEWTVEVFDKALLSSGAGEDQMVQLLQVALKCTNPSPDARPSMNQVATMIDAIKEEDERSIASEA
ncbi:probable inactive receptor kinase At2g26730 [Phoenix dactylifera]|uniref:Probable inactive receptor kinase At2g26730 n=1 Tax=Phoenix dactylifera TaxID=42345 RepID=A0A8B7BLJ4_PHODC|nr:probable inactive receptor kinase At2g26730 [Phoenix dactylifera]